MPGDQKGKTDYERDLVVWGSCLKLAFKYIKCNITEQNIPLSDACHQLLRIYLIVVSVRLAYKVALLWSFLSAKSLGFSSKKSVKIQLACLMQSECILKELWKICIQVARLGKLAVLCVAPQAYYCLLTSMTVSNCKAPMSGPSMTC